MGLVALAIALGLSRLELWILIEAFSADHLRTQVTEQFHPR